MVAYPARRLAAAAVLWLVAGSDRQRPRRGLTRCARPYPYPPALPPGQTVSEAGDVRGQGDSLASPAIRQAGARPARFPQRPRAVSAARLHSGPLRKCAPPGGWAGAEVYGQFVPRRRPSHSRTGNGGTGRAISLNCRQQLVLLGVGSRLSVAPHGPPGRGVNGDRLD